MKSKLLRQVITMSKRTFYGFILACTCYGAIMARDLNAQNLNKSIQEIYVSIEVSNVPVRQVLYKIERETGFAFAYNSEKVNLNQKVSLKYNKSDLASILMEISRESNLKFKRINNYIHIGKRKTFESIQVEEKISEQTRTITGKVTSMEDEDGLPGVNVIVKGTSTGTVTDVEGNYSLEVPEENAILVFSSVGFVQEEVVVGNQSVIDIMLSQDITALEEIVVIGYGSIRKTDVTGAVGQISGDELLRTPSVSAAQSLQGRVPGVQVISSQEPGGSAEIRIRGISTINNSKPLYVIDGFLTGGMDHLHPTDIKSVEVLKDASATSIYGSRGANGVILITTNSGNFEKKTTVNFNSYLGSSHAVEWKSVV